MSSIGAINVVGTNLRVAGTKDQRTGVQYGGSYFPAYVKNGKPVSARWEGNCYANKAGYTDSEGNWHEGNNVMLRIVAWNGRNAADGKGLADIFAKCASLGKEFSAGLVMNNFDKRLMINGQPIVDAQGNQITYPGYSFAVDRDLIWGQDSAQTIEAEIRNWKGNITFDSRPPQWNVPGTADNEAWKAIVQARMAHQYTGGDVYGYAKVIQTQSDATQGGQQISGQAGNQQQQFNNPPQQQFNNPPQQQQFNQTGDQQLGGQIGGAPTGGYTGAGQTAQVGPNGQLQTGNTGGQNQNIGGGGMNQPLNTPQTGGGNTMTGGGNLPI